MSLEGVKFEGIWEGEGGKCGVNINIFHVYM